MWYNHYIIGASLSEPYTCEYNGGIFIYYYCGITVVRILYVCLDCNRAPHAVYK